MQTRELPLKVKTMAQSEMQKMCVGTSCVVLNFIICVHLRCHVHSKTLVYAPVRPVSFYAASNMRIHV